MGCPNGSRRKKFWMTLYGASAAAAAADQLPPLAVM
jgi:hypothetical protein